MAKDYLAKREGWLCVVSEDTMEAEPELYRNFYPCFRIGEREYKEDYSGKYDLYQGTFAGEYIVFFENGMKRKLQLCDGGRTRTIHHEREPVPLPKVRKGIETRWSHGEWQKYLKQRGWVAA